MRGIRAEPGEGHPPSAARPDLWRADRADGWRLGGGAALGEVDSMESGPPVRAGMEGGREGGRSYSVGGRGQICGRVQGEQTAQSGAGGGFGGR